MPQDADFFADRESADTTDNNANLQSGQSDMAEDPWVSAERAAGVSAAAAKAEAQEMLRMLNPLLDDQNDTVDDGAAAAKLADSLTSVQDSLLAAESGKAAQQVYEQLLTRAGEANPRPRIEPVRRLAELAGMPQTSYPIIQVAGTNGKTSTSRIIESLLRAHGLRTGLFTSPHLVNFTERFVLDGESVDGVDLALAWQSLQPALQTVDAELEQQGNGRITFFEALTVLAFALFADAPVDVAVIEVGLGGQWDASNIADAEICVFTPIDLDHTALLGDSYAQIARTKSRIIKQDAIAVTAKQHPEAAAEITKTAAEFAVPVYTYGSDFQLLSDTSAVGGRLLGVKDIFGAEHRELLLPLHGKHQAENAALAIAAVSAFFGRALDNETVQAGLENALSPGRLQTVAHDPLIVVDAAHNPHGARATSAAFAEAFSPQHTVLVAGALADKDAAALFAVLAENAAEIFLTPVTSERSLTLAELAEHSKTLEHNFAGQKPVTVCESLEEALELAQRAAKEHTNAAILVAGSILLAGEAISIFGAKEQ